MEQGKRLMLHACCGPCTIEPLRLLLEDGWDVTIAYVNSNIHPHDEYLKRLATLREFADSRGIEVVEGPYEVDAWMRDVAPSGDDREARCRACYRMRLAQTARIAQELGCDAIGTTLSVSPYQLTDTIAEELESAARDAGLKAVFGDYRERYPEATRISRELGMYRQNYCGCVFSEREAAQDREERKRQRRQEVQQRAAARAQQEVAERAKRDERKHEREMYDAQQRRKREVRDALRRARKAELAQPNEQKDIHED